MVSEKIIENCIEFFDENQEEVTQQFLDEQEEILSYIKTEISPNLKDEEFKILIFCFTIIFTSVRNYQEKIPDFDIELYEVNDDLNWGKRDKTTSFEKSKDELFKNYIQEDLLAFVEDLIEDDDSDDEETLSDVGREIIFINSKSYIDTLCRINQP